MGMRVASLWAAVAGAAVQAVLMWHTLVDWYPYKMMTHPPGTFYASIALVAIVLSIVITVVVCRKLRVQWCALAVLIGVPVVFLLTFVLAHSLARVDMYASNNFDQNTPAMVLSEFGMEVARRMMGGAVVGVGWAVLAEAYAAALLWRRGQRTSG